MRYTVKLTDKATTIPLGRWGEKNVTEIALDVTDWIEELGSGTVTLWLRRSEDSDFYPASTSMDGNIAYHTLTDGDMQYSGHGEFGAIMTVGSTQIKKSRKYNTVVLDAVESDSTTPPAPYQSWVTQVLDAADRAEEAEEKIEDMTATAEVDNSTGTPSVEVTKTEEEEGFNLHFSFHNIKGNPGSNPSWSDIQDKPTTVSGFGITDAYTKTETDSAIAAHHDSTKQDATDDNLETTSKTIVGAINELDAESSQHSSNIVSLQNDKYDSTNLFFVNAQSNNSSFGNVVGTNVYKKDTSCTVTATAKVGYSFVKWIDTNTSAQVSTNATYTFTVTANKNLTAIFKDENLEIVSWASGTDAQICAMIRASDEGLIDLHDYWSVGDTRTVTLSAMAEDTSLGYEAHASQSVELVLMDTTCTGITLTSTGTAPSFIVGQKDGLLETGKMNTTDTNAGGWGASMRRGWCNDVYKVAIPSTLRSIFKQFTWQYVTSGTDGTLLTANDYFAMTPEYAVFNSGGYSRTEERALFSQWAYYNTSSNRIKHTGTSGSASGWWECSPFSGGSGSFCRVSSGGGAGYGSADNSSLLAPFGCI